MGQKLADRAQFQTLHFGKERGWFSCILITGGRKEKKHLNF
jgi:hypothetical protein